MNKILYRFHRDYMLSSSMIFPEANHCLLFLFRCEKGISECKIITLIKVWCTSFRVKNISFIDHLYHVIIFEFVCTTILDCLIQIYQTNYLRLNGPLSQIILHMYLITSQTQLSFLSIFDYLRRSQTILENYLRPSQKAILDHLRQS